MRVSRDAGDQPARDRGRGRRRVRRYERALVGNDVAVLTELFWRSPLHDPLRRRREPEGWQAIVDFRQARPAVDLERDLIDTVITTYGRDFATASTEYRRKQSGRRGRQMQTWLRTPDGWRVVAAHVSFLPD